MEKETINRLIRDWSGIDRDDFDHDLNAMHDVEGWLQGEQIDTYLSELTKIVELQWRLCRATASQRAEALLRTIGKWTDSTLHTKG